MWGRPFGLFMQQIKRSIPLLHRELYHCFEWIALYFIPPLSANRMGRFIADKLNVEHQRLGIF